MSTTFGFTRQPLGYTASRKLLRWLSVLLLPGVLAAQQEPLVEQEPVTGQQETSDTAVNPIPPDTHASQQAPQELLVMAVHEPENFIGKMLILNDGVDGVTVGPVTDLRKRLQDDELYLIVDATRYFNAPTQYAVAVRDLDKMEADTLIIPQAPGMHLEGLDYYPEDYTDLGDSSAETAADIVE